ncbi:hypothetical protein I0Q12_11040 [Rhodococcus sp. CX]|uniref:effector-associated constant component EACC1 n=1 Tax=Rhodococcus sp. CX TaxID=2789880 RepID=UPI0018CE6157|nr:hypothetical protein [Rhodococcus sp. CX]MBH0120021.1 hypothetical protein [Rhodococcus sp. CX]
MTEFHLSIAGSQDDAEELRDLYAAILDDNELRTARKSVVQGAPKEGQMGAEDTIRLVVDSPALWTAVSSCVTAWLATRESRLRLVVHAIRSSEIESDGHRDVTSAEVNQALIEASEGSRDEAARQ